MMDDRTLPHFQDPDCVTPLARVHEVFGRWLGKDYDTTVLDAVLAVAAARPVASQWGTPAKKSRCAKRWPPQSPI